MSRSKKNPEKNEARNDMHACDGKKERMDRCNVSLADIPANSDEVSMIWDFYVSHAPVIEDKEDKDKKFGLRELKDYDWKGSGDATELEKELLKVAGLGRFVMIKADEIDETLQMMDLGVPGEICLEHPRAVLKLECSVSFKEDGRCEIKPREKRMACLFRHIRNSLAHNRIYLSENGEMILLEDFDNRKVTARILIKCRTLLDWIGVVDKKHEYYGKDDGVESAEKEVKACPA